MAEAHLKTTKLKLVFDFGLNEENKPVYKSKTYHNITRYASADDLYQTAQAIESLSMHPLWAVERNDSFEIDQ